MFLANDKLADVDSPVARRHMYELDVRSICHNLLATLARQPEAYHRKVLAGAKPAPTASAAFTTESCSSSLGLNERLQYDSLPRKSLIDHFYDNDATLAEVAGGKAIERGDFASGAVRGPPPPQPQPHPGPALATRKRLGQPLKITKGITLEAGSSTLEIAYLIEGLQPGQPFHFSVEFNFAGLPVEMRRSLLPRWRQARRLGHLGQQLDLHDARTLSLVDEYLGIDVGLEGLAPTGCLDLSG